MTIKKPDKKILYHLYIEKELSSNDIAKIYNCSGTTVKKWMKNYNIRPRTHKENGIRMWKDPKYREKTIIAQLEGWENPIAHDNASKGQKKRFKAEPQNLSEIGTYPELEGIDDNATFEQFGYYSTQLSEKSGRLITRVCKICGRSKNIQKHAYSVLCQRCATQTEEFCKIRSKIAIEQFSIKEARERISATKQGQDYDNGEWSGFARGNQLHLIPVGQCLQLNPWFEGCVRHHIMSGVIIHIPAELHKSVWHRMTNGDRKNKNMKKINKLAFKYLLSGL